MFFLFLGSLCNFFFLLMGIFLHQHLGCLAEAGVRVSTGTRKATCLLQPPLMSSVFFRGGGGAGEFTPSGHPPFSVAQKASHA